MKMVRVILEMPAAQYQLWKKSAESFEELPEDFNPDDYAGGNMDDCFWNGFEHGSNEVYEEVIFRVKEVVELPSPSVVNAEAV